jgi:hypothetical protein
MEDVVGETSARLLATGVPAGRRRRALRLLGVLESVAGPDLRIRRPIPDVAIEFGLDPDAAAEGLDDLVRVGTVELDGNDLVLLGVEPQVDGALRLHDFLALVDEIDAPPAAARRRVGVPAGLLVAAALLVLALVSTATGGPDRQQQAASARAPSSASAPRRPSAGAPTPNAGAGPTTTDAAVTPPPGPAAAATPTTHLAACPAVRPVVELVSAVPELAGSIRNDTDTDAVVHSVVVQGVVVPVEVQVPAHASTPWSADPTAAAPSPALEAELGSWQWVGCA